MLNPSDLSKGNVRELLAELVSVAFDQARRWPRSRESITGGRRLGASRPPAKLQQTLPKRLEPQRSRRQRDGMKPESVSVNAR